MGGGEGREVCLLECDEAAGELKEGEVILVLLGPADENPAVAVQPGVTGLDDPAPRPPAGCSRFELDLFTACTDVWRVAVLDRQVTYRRRVIAAIEAQPLRTPGSRLGTLDRDAFEGRL